WAGQKTRFILPMSAPQIASVSKPRKVAMVASLLLVCSAAFFVYKNLAELTGMNAIDEELKSIRSEYAQLDAQYQREVKAKEAMGFDVLLVQNSIKVYQDLQKQDIKTLKLFKQIGIALGQDLNLDRLSVKKSDPGAIRRMLS